jgi:putative membrane protein
MRLIKSILLVLLIVLFAIFVFQNMERVRLSFLNIYLEMPVSLASVIIYLLGALTGGLLYSMLKKLTFEDKPKEKE